jgi:hypothetical protein
MVAAKVHRAKVKKLATKGKKKKVSTSLNFYLGSTPTDSFVSTAQFCFCSYCLEILPFWLLK